MANPSKAIGFILANDDKERDAVLNKIRTLPDVPYTSHNEFAIWQGIFHAPTDPSRSGYMISFALSHKYFGEPDLIVGFLDFWEDFIADLPASELFMAVDSFCGTPYVFSKLYFEWRNEQYPKSTERRWVFHGVKPYNEEWKSRFEIKLDQCCSGA